MDRKIIYPGQIPLETDLLGATKNAYIGLSKLAAAIFGTGATFANGLAAAPNSPADLTVLIAPGEIYALKNIDDSVYSSIAADTAHQILKQGILLDQAQLSCPAPGTAGQSINYLVQAAFSEGDNTPVALPYYNAANPSQAWVGPNNTGATQNTNRADLCAVTVKAGTAAPTGSQTTPTPDTGNVGLWVVTVANGQTTITAGNISQYAGAPFISQGGAASNAHNAMYSKSVAGNSNITLDAAESAYPIIKLTGALTGNINVIVPAASRQWTIINATSGNFTLTVKTAAGTGYAIPQGIPAALYCDGTSVDLQNELGTTPSQFDISKRLATMDAVKRIGLQFNSYGGAELSATSDITATSAGGWFIVTGVATTQTLPQLSQFLYAGVSYTFLAATAFTLKGFGTDGIKTSATGLFANTYAVKQGQTVTVTANTDGWYVTIDGFGAGSFASVLTQPGSQKLPGGGQFRFGVATTSASADVTVTYSSAFPNGTLSVGAFALASGALYNGQATAIPGAGSFQLAGYNAANARASFPVYYIAIGW